MIRSIRRLFFFILIFSPLSFGARAQWSFGIVTTAVITGFLLFLIHKQSNRDPLHKIPGILPLSLFCLWILIQIVPLPYWLVKLVSNNTYELYQNTSSLVNHADWIPLSINPHATLAEFFRYTTYAVFYIFTIQILKDSVLLKKTVNIIAGLAAAIAGFALIQYVISKNMIYGIRTVPGNATPFGPYIYHNHFAGYMEMLFPVILGLFLYYRPRLSNLSPRKRFYEFLSHSRTNPHLLYGFCAVLTGASVFVCYSRGGIISLCCSMLFMTITMSLMVTGKKREGMFLFFLVVIIILFSVGWFGWDVIFERFQKIRNADGIIQDNRISVWQDTIRIIKDFPLTGTGFGTFVHIYPGYRTVEGDLLFDHAHNDYLEFFSCGGIVGMLLFGWFFAAVIYQTAKIVRKRRDIQAVYIYLGSITGIVAVLIHSITDFNMQNGANGLYFFFLLGLSVSAANTRRKTVMSATYLPEWNSAKLKPLIAYSALFLVIASVVNFTGVIGQFHFFQIQSMSLDAEISQELLKKIRKKAYQSTVLDPLNARYHYGIGNIELKMENVEQAIAHFKRAVLLNPAKGEYLQRLGFILSGNGNALSAEKLMKAGIQMDIRNFNRYRDYAVWLAQQGQIPKSIVYFRQCMTLEPSKLNLDHCISLMKTYQFTENDIYRSIPRKSQLYVFYGEHLAHLNQPDKTAKMYDKALSLVKQEDRINPWYFTKVSRFYQKNGRSDKALKVIQQGILLFPENAHFRLLAGDLYKKNGIMYRAKEEYQNALIIDSGNIHAQKQLAELK